MAQTIIHGFQWLHVLSITPRVQFRIPCNSLCNAGSNVMAGMTVGPYVGMGSSDQATMRAIARLQGYQTQRFQLGY